MKYSLSLCSISALMLLLLSGQIGAGGRRAEERLSLDEARTVMLNLINRDRVANGLRTVTLDPIATVAGQKHTDEMVSRCYLAHWSLDGKLPDQRYTEMGGTHFVQENLFLGMKYYGSKPDGDMPLDEDATFTRRELEDIELSYMNETPPNDGHRKNILDPMHVRVGIAFSRANNNRADVLANAQEFLNKGSSMTEIPRRVSIGQTVNVSGKIEPGVRFRAITLGRYDLPASRSIDDLRRTHSYGMPTPFAVYCPEGYVTPEPVHVQENGTFNVRVALSDQGAPGLYYITLWLRNEYGKDFISSQRTVVVR